MPRNTVIRKNDGRMRTGILPSRNESAIAEKGGSERSA
jgi:hypothetical protein